MVESPREGGVWLHSSHLFLRRYRAERSRRGGGGGHDDGSRALLLPGDDGETRAGSHCSGRRKNTLPSGMAMDARRGCSSAAMVRAVCLSAAAVACCLLPVAGASPGGGGSSCAIRHSWGGCLQDPHRSGVLRNFLRGGEGETGQACEDAAKEMGRRTAPCHGAMVLRGGATTTSTATATANATATAATATANDVPIIGTRKVATANATGNATSAGPKKRMTRAISEVTFPELDSYAFNYGYDLGFSLFLERRCKRIYFIGNAEGLHNSVHQDQLKACNGGFQFHDAQITARGNDECFFLQSQIVTRKPRINFQLIVVSPLTRALQTAVVALGSLKRSTPVRSRVASRRASPNSEEVGKAPAAGLTNLEELSSAVAGLSLNRTSGDVKSSMREGGSESSRTVPIIALELCRERITGLPCDLRRPTSVLKEEFPTIDFSMISDDEDPFSTDVQEDAEMCRNRAKRFLQWLCTRPEQRIAVVSHSGFLKHLFALTGESSTAKVAPMDQHELRQRPLHAEMRSVLLAAHRKIDENEVLQALAQDGADMRSQPHSSEADESGEEYQQEASFAE